MWAPIPNKITEGAVKNYFILFLRALDFAERPQKRMQSSLFTELTSALTIFLGTVRLTYPIASGQVKGFLYHGIHFELFHSQM
jgi:hypothetical protein